MLGPTDLTPVERSIVLCAQTGSWWYAPSEGMEGPVAAVPAVDRTVRARFVSQLLAGIGGLAIDGAGEVVGIRALRIRGADVTGMLDLGHLDLRVPVEFVDCQFTTSTPLGLNSLSVPYLSLRGSRLRGGLFGRRLHVKGDLDLSYLGTTGAVDLSGASVSGRLLLDSAHLQSQDTALWLNEAELKQGLSARELSTRGGVYAVNLTTAYVNLDGAQLYAPGGVALLAEGLKAQGNVFMRGDAKAEGTVSLKGASVDGVINFDGASIRQPGGLALWLNNCSVKGEVVARSGFFCEGRFEMLDARVDGSLNFNSAYLMNEGDKALAVDRSNIGGAWLMRSGFLCLGEISAIDTTVRAEVALDGADLRNPGGSALSAQRLSAGDFFLRSEARVLGLVSLRDARVRSNLQAVECSLGFRDSVALDLSGATVGGTLWLQPLELLGSIDLRGATTEAQRGPTENYRYHLNGYKYERLLPALAVGGLDSRLAWLARDPDGYAPGPYQVLAGTLRTHGDAEAAKRVMIASQAQRRRQARGAARPFSLLWSYALRATIGYGYRPTFALAWLAVVLLGGAAWLRTRRFDFAAASGAPDFNSALYLLDLMVPFVDFGYSKWIASGITQVISVMLVILGYVLVAALLAALAGVFKRGD